MEGIDAMPPGAAKGDDLSQGMDASVGATGADNPDGLLRQPPEGSLYLALYGAPLRLKLKAFEISAVVFKAGAVQRRERVRRVGFIRQVR